MTEVPPIRDQVLAEAQRLIGGQRRTDYGDPRESFVRLAQMWSALLPVQVTPAQVALCLAALKLSRASVTPEHADSWVDLAGYAALGAEVSGAVL